MALSRPGVITTLQAIGLLLTVPLMLVLVPRFGIEGAALSLLLSTCARFAFVLASFSRFLGLPRPGLLPRRADLLFLSNAVFRRLRALQPSVAGGGHEPGRPLNIFVPHCSDLLTDHRPHGDGLVCHALISRLAERGHQLYIAASRTDLRNEMPRGAHLYDLKNESGDGVSSRFHYMWRVRKLFQLLQEKHRIRSGSSAQSGFHRFEYCFTGCGLPVFLGPFFARWPNDPTALSSSRSVAVPPIGEGKDIDSIVSAESGRLSAPLHDRGAATARAWTSGPST